MIYYIADLHIGDQRVFDLCSRPFSSLEEYERELIRRWNAKVEQQDIVYILGDISNVCIEHVKEIFDQLHGIKRLIIGNHDEEFFMDYFVKRIVATATSTKYIDDDGRMVFLCHYPVMDWSYGDKTIHHVYGHIHNKSIANGYLYEEIKMFYKNKLAYNASIDVTNYEPVTLDELIQLKEESENETYCS